MGGGYYQNIYRKFIVPTIVWCVIATTYMTIVGDPITIENIMYRIYKGSFYYHMWYMFMFIGLSIATPFIKLIKDIHGDKIFFIVGIVLLLIAILNTLKFEMFWPISFINYVGYYILGYMIPKIAKCRGVIWLMAYLLGSTITFIGYIYFPQYAFYSYHYPSTIIASFGLFMFVLTTKWSIGNLHNISKYSFDIYLMHAFIITIYFKLFEILHFTNDIYLTPIVFLLTVWTCFTILKIGGSVILNHIYTSIANLHFK